jgi:SH3 domain-containing YSC84-like protein 1
MLTYSRAKGLFAGVDLGGSIVERDKDSTIAIYDKDLPTRAILDGKLPAPADARPFIAEVRRIKMRARAK